MYSWNVIHFLAGAYGQAVLYKRKEDESLVILKKINILELNKVERQGVVNEITILSMLMHPHIITYYDHFEEEGSMMIEMEYADGGWAIDKNIFGFFSFNNIFKWPFKCPWHKIHTLPLELFSIQTRAIFFSIKCLLDRGWRGNSPHRNTIFWLPEAEELV